MTAPNTASLLEGLATKLERLDLTVDERRVLESILGRAAGYEAEVEGFLLTDDGTLVLLKDDDIGGLPAGAGLAPRLAKGLGVDPAGVWTDMRPLS